MAAITINTPYSNFYLANEISDQFDTHLNHQNFATVDNTLEGTAGMIKRIHTYSATDGTQKLEQGHGNTQSIVASYSPQDYTIQLAQNRFEYYDEEAMTDPIVIETGIRHAGTDMFNTVNADIVTEFGRASLSVSGSALNFDIYADAVAELNMDDGDPSVEIFSLINVSQTAELRKNLKDTLQYVEAYARRGYIGTVAGVNIYTSKIITTPVVATKKAVTVFNKKGVEVERITAGNRAAADANVRKNTIYARKYYLAALTDATQAVKLTIAKG